MKQSEAQLKSHRAYYQKNKQFWQEHNKEYQKKFLSDPKNRLYKATKCNAKVKGIEHTITKDDIVIPAICPLLGIPLYMGNGVGHRHDAPSLDRIDNTKGYIPGNVWVISRKANTMKYCATTEELVLFSENILRLMKDGRLKLL